MMMHPEARPTMSASRGSTREALRGRTFGMEHSVRAVLPNMGKDFPGTMGDRSPRRLLDVRRCGSVVQRYFRHPLVQGPQVG
ncbi:hypothetical protein Q664_11445 [Archangium violaceum Cb vi76]|uniref:Uncharacterized protein n=1 Tax=Archangium violaceum Cb vi76 TaxID=1406225 RepID=A0A084SXA9_9BACT|nr:hypothetical protein Q664_11445 [Archangium violaceum Cb vi76]